MGLLKKTSLSLLLGLIIAAVVLATSPAQASALSGSEFRADNIISDSMFFNGGAMSAGEIQAFLNSKVPNCDTNGTQQHSSGQSRASYGASRGYPAPYTCLKDFRQDTPSKGGESGLCNGFSGGNKSAADIIFEVGQSCGVSQKALIVTLQKEQGLITDDWPWSIQYRSAMGYGCPDTAPCDSEYYGFFNQVYNAARQFKRYSRDRHLFNFAAGRSSFVQYHPNSGCGGTTFAMQNQATAGLYNYTPYQPNAAALNNLYGTGDGCSAYGNRNFWRMFNDWFGSTSTDGFMRVIGDDGSPAQFVIYRSMKQQIISPDVLDAWGMNDTPLITVSAAYLNSLPSGSHLDRYFRINGSEQVYFCDRGKRYKIPNDNLYDAWGFSGRPISDVSRDLGTLPVESGDLTYGFKKLGGADVYMAGGRNGSGAAIAHKYSNDNVLSAWENSPANVTVLSDAFFNVMDNAIGSEISATRISHGGNQYQVAGGRRYPLNAPFTSLYPSTTMAVSSQVFSRLPQSPPMKHLVQSMTGSATYLIDGGTKHHVLWPDAKTAWTAQDSYTTYVNDGFLNLIPDGGSIGEYLADVDGQLYIINSTKTAVPGSLDTAYRNTGTVYDASSSLMDVFPTSGITPTGFIKSSREPQVYLLDNSGRKRHLQWADKVTLWGGWNAGITEMPHYIVDPIEAAESPSIYVTDGTSNYAMYNGQKLSVSAGVKTNWGFGTAQSYTDGTLSRFSAGSALTNSMTDGGGGYYLVRDGAIFGTSDRNIADLWGIGSAPTYDGSIIRYFGSGRMLAPIVRSSTDSRTFLIDNGNWYNLPAAYAANLASGSRPYMTLNPSNAPNSITDWTNYMVKDGNGNHYVIENGNRRFAPTGLIRNQWTQNGSLSVPTMSNAFMALMPERGIIERSVQGSAPTMYFVENGTKRHILYPNLLPNYSPFANVHDHLLNLLPNGANISQ